MSQSSPDHQPHRRHYHHRYQQQQQQSERGGGCRQYSLSTTFFSENDDDDGQTSQSHALADRQLVGVPPPYSDPCSPTRRQFSISDDAVTAADRSCVAGGRPSSPAWSPRPCALRRNAASDNSVGLFCN